jgi:LysM repeat protein
VFYLSSSIVIKIADGKFYPILPEKAEAKKRLVLTTVHDGQKSAQIDLYRSPSGSMHDAHYIGTLVVENISPKKKGDPSVELIIASDAEGEISAKAKDLDNPEDGEVSALSVFLESVDRGSIEAGDDFDLEGSADEVEEFEEVEEKRSIFQSPILVIIVVLAAVFCLWFFMFDGNTVLFHNPAPKSASERANSITPKANFDPPPVVEPPLTAVPVYPRFQDDVAPAYSQTKVAAEPVVKSAYTADVKSKGDNGLKVEPVVKSAYVAEPDVRTAPPVMSYNVPKVIPKGGFAYKVRWGDTLWDISNAFYRSPAYYKYIAKYNGIKNPNRIISGITIRIPPR